MSRKQIVTLAVLGLGHQSPIAQAAITTLDNYGSGGVYPDWGCLHPGSDSLGYTVRLTVFGFKFTDVNLSAQPPL